MRFLFLFTIHQFENAWRKFANNALKVTMLQYNRNSSHRKIHLYENKARYVNQKAVNPGVCEKNESYSHNTWKTFAYHW